MDLKTKLYCGATTVVAGAAFVTFILLLLQGISNSGVVYESTTPLNASWIGLASFVGLTTHLLWVYLYSSNYSRVGAWFWAIVGGLFVLAGILVMIGFAVLPNDALAAGLAILFWTVPGAMVTVQSRRMLRGAKARCCSRSNCSLCGGLVSGVATLVLLFFGACFIGIVIQTLASAANYHHYKPIGSIHTITSDQGFHLRMHMACGGPENASKTWVFEHGGGANSLSLKYIADRVAEAGHRACVYDRLGYGWTPSYVTRNNRLKFESDASLLGKLLAQAGETGPFVCVGHSDGANKCLSFAMVHTEVEAIVFADGYPDIVRPGVDAFGTPNVALVNVLKLFAFLVGPTGLTRGIVGKTDPKFVPHDVGAASTALYAQQRFMFSQLWDVQADVGAGDDGFLFHSLNGTQAKDGVITYGRQLNVSIGIFPADSTVTPLDCSAFPDTDCCKNAATQWCVKAANDRELYRQQSLRYAETLGVQTGVYAVAPAGSEHTYSSTAPYADWLARQLLLHFGK